MNLYLVPLSRVPKLDLRVGMRIHVPGHHRRVYTIISVGDRNMPLLRVVQTSVPAFMNYSAYLDYPRASRLEPGSTFEHFVELSFYCPKKP